MTTSSSDPYILPRSAPEQARLNTQHDLWTRAIGSLLPPSLPPSTLPPTARIADLGTGTAIWPISLSTSPSTPPTWTYTGYDISPSLFPPVSALPVNVTLRVADFKSPFPDEEKGTYDLVNIRLIVVTLGPVDVWRRVLAHALELLKPGGILVWTEGDFFSARGYRGGVDPSAPSGAHLCAAQDVFNASLVRRFGYWFPSPATGVSFAGLLEDAGMQRVRQDVVSTDRDAGTRSGFTALGVGAVFGGLERLAAEGAEGCWGVEEVGRRRAEVEREVQGGAYLRWDIHVVVGFKAAA